VGLGFPTRTTNQQKGMNQMRTLKTVGLAGALVAAALIGGTLISAVFAASPAPSGTTTDPSADPSAKPGRLDASKYSDAFLDKLASELGVDRAALGPAALAASNAAIDAAVAAGDLTADQAAALKTRLAALDDPATLLARPGFGHGPRGGHDGFGVGGFGPGLGEAIDAAATALKLDKAALVEAVRDGKSLKEIAADQKVDYATVSTAILDVVKKHLTDEVTAKDLSQARADSILEQVTTWLAAGGDLPTGRWHR
jgi:DNA-binding NarL/FixJ family response regulator